MSLDGWLLDKLCDPLDKGTLWYVTEENVLLNPRTGQVYEVRGDIAVMLADEATVVADDERARLLALPGRYTGSQSA